MSKWSKLAIIIMLIALLVIPAGCGSSSEQPASGPSSSEPSSSESAGDSEPVTLKLAHGLPPGDIHGRAYQYYADQVAEMSNGEIQIEIFPGGSLAGNPQMFKAVQTGVTDIGIFPSSFVAPQMKEVTIFEIPGVFDHTKIAEVQEQIAPVMDEIHAKYGMKYLWPTSEGELVLGVSKEVGEPVKTVDDIKGLKIRDYGQWIGRALETWGAIQTTIPPADLNAALDRGVVQGSVASWSFSFGFKVYEQAPYFTMFDTNNMWHWATIREDAWNKLSSEQQQVLIDAGEKAMEFSIDLEAEEKGVFEKAVTDGGGVLYELTPEAREEFVSQAATLIDDIREISGPEGNELIDTLQAMQ